MQLFGKTKVNSGSTVEVLRLAYLNSATQSRWLFLLLCISLATNFFQSLREAPPPQSFATDEFGRISKLEPVNVPLGDVQVTAFVKDSLPDVFTMSGPNYDHDVAAKALWFTDRSFENYKSTLERSGLKDQLVSGALSMGTVVQQDPVITKKMSHAIGDRFGWVVRVERTVRTLSSPIGTKNYLIPFNVYVVRTSSLERARQLAIFKLEQGQASEIR